MSVSRSRILDLTKVQCRIFSTTFNPERLRLGNKVLRQRLKGPTVAAYYPKKVSWLKELRQAFPKFEIWDEVEMDRLDKIENAKRRGKGAPKKKSSAAESKKFVKKKKAPSTAAPTF